jgi:hypothetical protein
MNLRQLKGLARESGVLLEKTSFFRTKKATKKEDITDLLRVLNTSKVRNYAGKVKLIKKPTEIRAKKVKAVKAYAMKKTRSTENVKKETESIEKKRKKGRVTDARTSDVFLARKEPIFRKEDQEDVNAIPPRGTKGDEMVEEAIRERIIEREIVRRRIGVGTDDNDVLRVLRDTRFAVSRRERAKLASYVCVKTWELAN